MLTTRIYRFTLLIEMALAVGGPRSIAKWLSHTTAEQPVSLECNPGSGVMLVGNTSASGRNDAPAALSTPRPVPNARVRTLTKPKTVRIGRQYQLLIPNLVSHLSQCGCKTLAPSVDQMLLRCDQQCLDFNKAHYEESVLNSRSMAQT